MERVFTTSTEQPSEADVTGISSLLNDTGISSPYNVTGNTSLYNDTGTASPFNDTGISSLYNDTGNTSLYNDTGTTSMISSLLGDDTPKYQPSLPEIREEDSSVYVSPRSLQAYTGPGRIIDPTYISDSRLNIDATPVANKMKAVLGSIEKLKTSSHLSLKGSSSHISSQSNAAISQVINALHTHDQTMKNLKDALNEIDIVTQESTMERKSASKLSSLRHLNKSQRILNNNDAAARITKEWVQNEVEIQIEYLRKSLNIDAIQNVLLQLKKEKIEEKEYRDHVKELIKHEVNDQCVEIRNSNQNLQELDRAKDQMQIEIIGDLQKQLRLILKDETEKIISTVSEKVPEYVTESALKLAIQDALLNMNNKNSNNSNNDVVLEKMNQLNQKVELLEKNILKENPAKSDHQLERRILKLEELLQKSNKPEVESRMTLLENHIQEIASQMNLSKNSTEEDATSGSSRMQNIEDRINELTTQLQSLNSDLSDENKSKLSVLDKKFFELDALVAGQISELNTTKGKIGFISEKTKLQEIELTALSLIQNRLNFVEIEFAKRSPDANLIARMNSVIDSRLETLNNSETRNDSGNQESISNLKADIEAQKVYIDSRLSECENVIQNHTNQKEFSEKNDLMNNKLADVSNKVDVLNAEAVLSNESTSKSITNSTGSTKMIENAVFKSASWQKLQDQIYQLSNLGPKLALVEAEVSTVKSLKRDMETLKKSVEKDENLLKQQQSTESSLDVNTRISVLTTRMSDVEAKSKTLEKINFTDIKKEMQETQLKLDRLDNIVKGLDEKVLSATMNQASSTEAISESKDMLLSAQLKIADMESLIKTTITPAIRKIEADHKDQGESLRTTNNNIKSLQEDKSSVQIEAWIASHISKLGQELGAKLENKVDNDVLEELVKHLATRDELKKVAKKKMSSISERRSNEHIRSNENIRSNDRIASNVLTELDENKNSSNLSKNLKKELEAYLLDQIKALEARLLSKEPVFTTNEQFKVDMDKKDMQSIKRFTESLINDKMKLLLNNNASNRARMEGSNVSDDEMEIMEQKMRREFDEKLFLLCSDLSSCKNMIASQLYEPFNRCAQWIWKSGHLKLGSAVPWNIQTRNTDEENFLWEQDSFNIKVAEAGLYEITLAFFTKTKPSVQLVVNGESIMSAINSPSYIVHHSSGYVIDGNGKMQEGVVSGLSLVDFLALPSKSTISIHYHGVKKQTLGHGFLGLRKL